MFDTRAANGSTKEFVAYGDRVVATATQEVATINGSMDIEEYVPGKGWIVRYTFSAVGTQELVSSSNGPTRWRGTTKSQTTGTWGLALR